MSKTKHNVEIALIGGTGVYDPALFKNAEQIKLFTPYGPASDLITIGEYAGKKVAFIPRHGKSHHLPPHKVNYRANIYALKSLGVKRILAACAVGSLREEFKPGQMVILDQFVDFTKTREYTFFDGAEVKHISMADPFCPELRKIAIQTAEKLKIDFHKQGTLLCTEGPRYSTRAESLFFRDAVKAHVIGMTTVPEAQLAREAEICYLSIAAVTDYDAWSDEPVRASMVEQTMKKNVIIIRDMLQSLIPTIPELRNQCQCEHALDEAGH